MPPPSGAEHGLPPASITHPVAHVPSNVSLIDGVVGAASVWRTSPATGVMSISSPAATATKSAWAHGCRSTATAPLPRKPPYTGRYGPNGRQDNPLTVCFPDRPNGPLGPKTSGPATIIPGSSDEYAYR